MRRLVGIVLAVAVTAGPRAKKEDAPTTTTTASAAEPPASAAPADAVSRASPTEEPSGPKVLTGGTVDGEALRARTHARLDHDRSPVTVLRGDDPRALGRRICEAVVPKKPAGTPILLKPNLGGFDWFKDPAKSGGDDGVKGRTTNPEFVRGVIQCLKARGHTKITVAEGWGATHADWLRLVEVSGYAAMTKAEGVPLVAMDDDGVFDKAPGEPGKPLAVKGMSGTKVPTLLVPKILAEHLDHGLFISIPKVKAHRFGVVTMGIKGVQGTVMLSDASPAFRQKSRMHKELNAWLKKGGQDAAARRAEYVKSLEIFAERIADVLEVEAPHVVLADAAPAMSGDGFQKLWPSAELLAIGGTNVVLVDRVGAELLGLWKNAALAKELAGHATSPLITVAAKRFGIDLDAVTVEGDGAAVLKSKRPVRYVSMAGFELDSTAGEPSERPEAHAAPLGDASLAIDGRADDAAWATVKPVSWTTDWSGEDTGITTRARFLWSKDALHALFELEGAGLNTDTSKPVDVEREKLWAEDCVELFLDVTPASKASYHEIEVGPFGHFLDLAVDQKKGDTSWSGDLQIGTTRDPAKQRATLELSIRAPEIVKALVPGARLPLGLYRMEGKDPRRYLAWSPTRTAKPNFHVPEAFGALVID